MNELKNKNIIFLGLAQNTEKTIKTFFKFYEKTKKIYNTSYLIIGEDNSVDNTKKILNKYKKKMKNFKLIDTSFIKKTNYRLEKMALLREYLLKETKKIKKKIHFVCWFDLDDVLKNDIEIKKFIFSNLKLIHDKKIFAVSASTTPAYYDILSYRKKNFFQKNIYEISLNKKIISGYSLRKKYIYDMQKKISNMKSHYTISSFNGMCIYHYKYFSLGSYLDQKSIMRSQVEHVTLNKKISKITNKNILVDKNFDLSLPIEHKPYFNILSFAIGKMRILLIKLIKNFF